MGEALLTAPDTLSRTHLRGHQAAVSTTVHIPTGERQLQADTLISQAAAEVCDHQPGAAVCRRTGRGEWPSLPHQPTPRPRSYVSTKATLWMWVRGAHRDSVLTQEHRPARPGQLPTRRRAERGQPHKYRCASRKSRSPSKERDKICPNLNNLVIGALPRSKEQLLFY